MEEIFETQRDFQNELKTDINSQEFRNNMFLGLVSEVAEVMNETEWKPWKNNQEFNRDKFVEELVDVQLFLFNLVLSSGYTYEDFVKKIVVKQDLNFLRQKNGY